MPSLISHLTTRFNPRNWASAPRRPYWAGLGVVVLTYVVTLGWFLTYTDGLPYVFDNNETFSSLVHASNIFRFGVRETFGLTDEAYGLEATQHPYVYTHGGNFPRFYALLLYVLGARTAEAQIVIATFTVGLAGLLFAYHYFSRISTSLFAVVYCLLLMTDYVMQTQWLVNTWRTWHHFFVFSSLLCVHALIEKRHLPRWLTAVTLLNFACLVYLELVFATTVILLASFYACLIGWRRPRRVVRGGLLIFGGAALGAAVLCAQVIGYLGWEGFREDVRLTFLARNTTAAELRGFRSEVWSFVEEHHLVFWDNFLGQVGFDSTVLRWCFMSYTPALVFVALLIASAWGLSLFPVLEPVTASPGSRQAWSARYAIPWATGAAALFACATLMDLSFAGLTGSRQLGGDGAVVVGALGAAVGGLGMAVYHRLRALKGDRLGLPASKVVFSAVLLLGFAALARQHPLLYYEGRSSALFKDLIGRTGGALVWHLTVLAAAALAVSLVLAPRYPMGPERRSFRRLFLFVLAGVVAVASAYRLFPGYVVTGYLQRYCPLTVYVHLIPFAAAFYVLARVSVHALRSLAAASRFLPLGPRVSEKPAESESSAAARHFPVLSLGALLLLCLLSWHWLMAQAMWLQRFDPRSTMLKELQKPQYRGASFVVNTYAAPAAFLTQAWAYFDPQMGKSELRNPEGKFYLRRDFRYLWLADKRSNANYFEPDFFLCWIPPQLLYSGDECQDLQLVAEARRETSLFGHREVARDQSLRDAWSVVRLNWTYPPGSGKKIEWHYRQFRRTLALPE